MKRILFVMIFALAGCQKSEDHYWQGYVEGEYVMLGLALRRPAAEAARAARRADRGGQAGVRARAGIRARRAPRGRAAHEGVGRRGSRTSAWQSARPRSRRCARS
jgi:hypothetical protein